MRKYLLSYYKYYQLLECFTDCMAKDISQDLNVWLQYVFTVPKNIGNGKLGSEVTL
jgi:hypothetical protein